MHDTKFNIEYTEEDKKCYLRSVFLKAFLDSYLEKHPEVKQDLESKFPEFVKQYKDHI